MTAPIAAALLPLKPLFLQGTVAAPVKTPAADTRLALGGLWTPDGADAIKVRSGVVWGPSSAAGTTPCGVYTSGTAGTLNINPGRLVIQGPTEQQGAYLGAITALTPRRVADFGGLPTAGQFKAGRVIARVYDQLFGDPVDGWTVELLLGSPATTAAGAVFPPLPAGALLLRNFTVDSNGAFTLSGTPTYTTPAGTPVVCTSTTRPANPWPKQRIVELDTGRELEWQTAGSGWTKPWGQAWGVIADGTAGFNGQGLTTGFLALCELNLGTLPANRKLRITAGMQYYSGSNTVGTIRFRTSFYQGASAYDGSDLDVRLGGSVGDLGPVWMDRTATTGVTGPWRATLFGMYVNGLSSIVYRILGDEACRVVVEDLGPVNGPL